MGRRALLIAVALAGAGGGLVGWLTRPRARTAVARPAAVEQALLALDAWEQRGDRSGLASARDRAGPPSAFASPWREELELVGLAAAGDEQALWRFAVASPPSAPRARALRRLSRAATDAALRERAARRLRADYPASWALVGDGVR